MGACDINPTIGFKWCRNRIVATTVAGADDTAVASERSPGSGWATIPATVGSTQAEWSFQLSANDAATGTSRFAVDEPLQEIPSAGVLGLLLLGILIAMLGILALPR